METYILRVQLSNGTPQNYTILKEALQKVGFSKKIVNKDGISYTLPNGNYLGESKKTIIEVMEIVKATLNRIGDPKALILVTESKRESWINLPIA